MNISKKFILFALSMPALLSLTGCWDKVEIENRAFAVSMGIDKKENFSVSLDIPDVTDISEKKDESDGKSSLKTAEHKTISGAINQIDSYSSKKLYFGHTKVCIISENLLKDERLLKEALDALDRNREIGRKMLIMCSEEDASEILEAKAPGEPMLGLFISNFYKNNKATDSAAFRRDLGDVLRELKETGHAVLPKIGIENDEIKIGGACVIKEYKLVGWLDEDQARGYLWITNEGKNSQISTEFLGTPVTLKVNNSSSKVNFELKDDGLSAIVDISIKGVIEGFTVNGKELQENLYELENLFGESVAKDIMNTAYCFQNEYNVDGFRFSDRMHKSQYKIYKIFANDWEQHFKQMNIIPRVKVDVTNTGAVK